jgi:hypothetical protein
VIKAPARVETEVSHRARFFSQLGVVGQYHASFARSNELIRVKTESTEGAKTSAATPARMLSVSAFQVLGPVHLGCILDYSQSSLVGERQHGIEIDTMSV